MVSGSHSDECFSRYGNVESRAERRVGFFLAPTFNMLPFIAAVEPLRVANRVSGRALYSWHVLTRDGEPGTASNGMHQAADGNIDEVRRFPVMIVCGPYDPHTYRDKKVNAWLRGLACHGAILGALETGSYVLARAGLLDGYRCTVHWENQPGFVAEFPDVDATGELYEFDRDRFTCAGGTAALDMVLSLIERDHGYELAHAVAERVIHHHIRRAHDPQRMSLRIRTGISHPKLLDCIALMEANVEQPLPAEELARMIGVSRRQVERLFRRYFATTPSRYYLRVRLESSRCLLQQTTSTVTEIALSCGFSTLSHFSLCYRNLFGVSPSKERLLA